MRFLSLLWLFALAVAGFAYANETEDQIERANLLRRLLEDRVPPRTTETAPVANLPGARLEAGQREATEASQIQQFQDHQWRSLLGAQQLQKNQPDMSGPASASAPLRALAFERDQRLRDLSMQIQRQDLEYRQNNRR